MWTHVDKTTTFLGLHHQIISYDVAKTTIIKASGQQFGLWKWKWKINFHFQSPNSSILSPFLKPLFGEFVRDLPYDRQKKLFSGGA